VVVVVVRRMRRGVGKCILMEEWVSDSDGWSLRNDCYVLR
jgi:hypothetical protein